MELGAFVLLLGVLVIVILFVAQPFTEPLACQRTKRASNFGSSGQPRK